MESRRRKRVSRPRASTDSAERTALDVRQRTLARLESILLELVERHGARMTLGEMLAITAGMGRICSKGQVTIGEVVEATGLPKQNVSRWARKRIGESVVLEVNPDDQRMHQLSLLDPMQGQESLEKIAKLIGTDRAGPR